MNDVDALISSMTNRARALHDQADDMISDLQILLDLVHPQSERLLFCSPVTAKIEASANIWGGDWFDATGYGTRYDATGKWAIHTGHDLNRPNYADAGATVYAAADGEIVFNGVVQGWQGCVIVIKHTLEDGSNIWTRYAHVGISLARGSIKRGGVLATIADYGSNGPKQDHLHFDGARIDLGAHPGDWPGDDLPRVKRDYIDMAQWLRERGK